ncbi:MAG: hypothetical protein M1833_005147 [Piccolia ochrophora]|nr:MAG: hypothetical protein M1833_005147 [Piccolia ochrophora]
MAGMEQLEIHSKSYLVRWVNVAGEQTISWSIQPHKKSINFGIFKHPGGSTLTPSVSTSAMGDRPPSPGLEDAKPLGRRGSSSRNDTSTAVHKLQSIGLVPIVWKGKCEADVVSTGKHDVTADQGGMYALIFDNTFSKQVSKTATVVILTYPSHAPPQARNHLHPLQSDSVAGGSTSSLHSKSSPRMTPRAVDSTESLNMGNLRHNSPHRSYKASAVDVGRTHWNVSSNYFTGVLQKRRRKRHQGYARRFFSLDFTSSTLSYYHDDHSSALRGSIPLSLAAIGANNKTREISVDSGAEVWHLRTLSAKDFTAWKGALEKASTLSADEGGDLTPAAASSLGLESQTSVTEQQEWARLESLLGRIAGTRDAVRRLTQGVDAKWRSPLSGLGIKSSSETASPTESIGADYFTSKEKRPFWKRATSSGQSSPSIFQRNVPTQSNGLPYATSSHVSNGASNSASGGDSMHHHCVALLHDLDGVVKDFSALVTESKKRRLPGLQSAASRTSIDSTRTQFYDAEEGHDSQLLMIGDSEDDQSPDDQGPHDFESFSDSDDGLPDSFDRRLTADIDRYSYFPKKPKSLAPLPMGKVTRRNTVPAATTMPPSLIGFLRKNVGKDLSTIAMPVSANEPTSLLQRISEQMEYSALLDDAASAQTANGESLLYVTAFAISAYSNGRVKDRAIRKPFNPMLGETFELIREDQDFRFIAEKVTHRPVRMACQAEAKDWTFTGCPMPTQKFWGKSVELNTEGRARVILHTSGECFSWTAATSFLRNVIAGEKYVEPVNSMTVLNESSGQKAVVTFKAKGMFSGRNEDVSVHTFDGSGNALPLGLSGKWTTALKLTENCKETRTIWEAGSLVEDAPSRYGLTSFAASLNEITSVEKDVLPPTDSRLRPDQRAAEQGDLDRAEALKAKLEEAQRARRKQMEESDRAWTPQWFEKVENELGEEIWRLKSGKEGYWESRERRDWEGVVNVFPA